MGPFPDGWTEDDVEKVLARGEASELLYVPIVVGMNANDVDRVWAERICLALSAHPHFNVRGNAILGFGHIARVCGDLTLKTIAPVISNALSDPEEYVRGHANDAASDLELYLGVVVDGYEGEAKLALREGIGELKGKNDFECDI